MKRIFCDVCNREKNPGEMVPEYPDFLEVKIGDAIINVVFKRRKFITSKDCFDIGRVYGLLPSPDICRKCAGNAIHYKLCGSGS